MNGWDDAGLTQNRSTQRWCRGGTRARAAPFEALIAAWSFLLPAAAAALEQSAMCVEMKIAT